MYTQILHIQPTVGLPSFSSSLLNTRTLDSPIFKEQSTQNSRTRVFLLHHYHRKLRPPLINCSANSEGVGSAKTWEKWLPRNFLSPDKVFEWISEATSSPIAQYISSPTTFLHSVDPRIKLVLLFHLCLLLDLINFLLWLRDALFIVFSPLFWIKKLDWRTQRKTSLFCVSYSLNQAR